MERHGHRAIRASADLSIDDRERDSQVTDALSNGPVVVKSIIKLTQNAAEAGDSANNSLYCFGGGGVRLRARHHSSMGVHVDISRRYGECEPGKGGRRDRCELPGLWFDVIGSKGSDSGASDEAKATKQLSDACPRNVELGLWSRQQSLSKGCSACFVL